MPSLFSPPTLDDLIRLLRAWRFWVLSALFGALFAAAIYALFPPPYRARATVNVDFNLEQAWPQESDREQFYYLERETRKLEEIAWSDAVLQAVADADGQITLAELRRGKLRLSQPAEAGWHFYAQDANPQRAERLAAVWAQAFVQAARQNLADQAGLNAWIRLEATQLTDLPRQRAVPQSTFLLAGVLSGWFVGAFAVLFFGAGRPITK
jgi:uncharacterized protein involved in exopolysaccharide biosynthesis